VDDGAPGPAGSTVVSATTAGGLTLTWPALAGAIAYDVVHGDLAALRSSGGNYTTATLGCVTDNLASTTVGVTDTVPPGAGYFYLVRGINGCAPGTYDSGAPSQVGSRDAEVNASALACP
jgi:hypothetical protein